MTLPELPTPPASPPLTAKSSSSSSTHGVPYICSTTAPDTRTSPGTADLCAMPGASSTRDRIVNPLSHLAGDSSDYGRSRTPSTGPGGGEGPLGSAAIAAHTTSRLLSDNELSYFLPSRADGVNDMYVHHGLLAPAPALSLERVRLAWALQLVRHPLLASSVQGPGAWYANVSFVHTQPSSFDAALSAGDERLTYLEAGGSNGATYDIVDAYLNGPRTLSAEILARLVVRKGSYRTAGYSGSFGPGHQSGNQSGPGTTEDGEVPFEVMLCTTHYVGDGVALHTFMNEFYTLVGTLTETDLRERLEKEIERASATHESLPLPLEQRLPTAPFPRAVGQVAQRSADAALLGGQVFPSRKGRNRHTVVPTQAYSVAETTRALANCKAHGVTVAHVVFALCAVAWARQAGNPVEPTLIYSALNMRPQMSPLPPNPTSPPSPSFNHLAVGYFNVVLPTILPCIPVSDLVWHRARQTKRQTTAAVKSPLVVPLFLATAAARAARSIHWAAIDDAQSANPGLGLGLRVAGRVHLSPEGRRSPAMFEAPPVLAGGAGSDTPLIGLGLGMGLGLGVGYGSGSGVGSGPGLGLALGSAAGTGMGNNQPPVPSPQSPASESRAPPPPPKGRALMGLSMLGHLDAIYRHAQYPDIKLHELTTGSRQRQGAQLLFAYTFAGKLWLSHGYDQNGFEDGVVPAWWAEVLRLADDVLLGESENIVGQPSR